MTRKTDVRLLFALAPVLALGTTAVVMASLVDPPSRRFVLEILAVGGIASASWRVGAAALGGTLTRAHGLPQRLHAIAGDARRTTFDRDTGLLMEWYFRLRVEEEISRAKRYNQPFSVLAITAQSKQVLDAARIAMRQWLRDVDFAGDLGDVLALCLPNTPKAGGEQAGQRLLGLVEGLSVTAAEYPSDGVTLPVLLGEDRWRIKAA
jgi:GGDEF domain-containing protein